MASKVSKTSVLTTSTISVSFRGYRPMAEEDKKALRLDPFEKPPVSPKSHDLLDEIFAPDPITHNPSSDLLIRLSADSEVRDYIDNYINNRVFDVPKTDDKDLALNTTKSKFETRKAYFERIKVLINGSNGK